MIHGDGSSIISKRLLVTSITMCG